MTRLLYERLPADFHRRLENWGEVMRDRLRRHVSPTYEICRLLAKRAGKTNAADEPPEWDEDDALVIERAWRRAAYRIDPRERILLRAHYVEGAYWKATCRFNGIRLREYDDVLVRAVENFEDFVALYGQRMHNPPQDRPTTV